MLELLRKTSSTLILAAAMAAFRPGAGQAEVRKMMTMCPGQKLCAWFQSTVKAPKGWIEDKAQGEQHFVTMLEPDKPSLGPSDPLIYVQTSLHLEPVALDENIKKNQDLWRKSEPEGRIAPIGAVTRAGGKEPFQVFLYENPSRPQQAFEKIAFALEKRPEGGAYVLTVVDTASTRRAIEELSDAFQAVLGGL